jgi:hypothetical protein
MLFLESIIMAGAKEFGDTWLNELKNKISQMG